MIKKLILLLLIVFGLFLVGCSKDNPSVDVEVVDGYVITVLDNTKPVKEYYVVVKLNEKLTVDFIVKDKSEMLNMSDRFEVSINELGEIEYREILDEDIENGYLLVVREYQVFNNFIKGKYVFLKNGDDEVLYDVKVKPKYPLLDINHDWNFPKGSIINVKTKELLPHRNIDNS